MYWVDLLWSFVLLSFLGWIFSGAYHWIIEKKFYNKGFLTLPFGPSYGLCGVACYVVFNNVANNPIITFVGSALMLSALSAIIGYTLELLLGCKPWDFSDTKLNIGSYTSIPNSVMLGIIGVFTVHMLIPPLNHVLIMIPETVSMIIVLSICGAIFIDTFLSLITVFRLRNKMKRLSAEILSENSGIDGEKLKELRENYNRLFTNSLLRKRMVNAFPELKTSGYVKQISGKLDEIKTENMKEYENKFERDEDKPFAYGLCFAKLFALFIVGSFLGTCIETVYAPFAEGHFELRVGMVYGPFIPVYGGGAVLLTVVLYKMYKLSDTMIFVISAFLGAFFEYISSWLQETILGTVSWDYSNMPLNLNGRTSLMYAFIWGFLGLIWVRYLYPFAAKWIEKIPKKQGSIITVLLAIFMVYNGILTVSAVYRWEQRTSGVTASNKFEEYLDKKYDDDRMKLLFPHMRHSDDLSEIQTGESRQKNR